MFIISLVIMAVLVAADQLIKLAVTNNLPLNGQPCRGHKVWQL